MQNHFGPFQSVHRTVSGFRCGGGKIIAFLAMAAVCAQAQSDLPPPSAHRPKIGLVLSGGGALGVSHIGVLKALEELRVPVDYVAGTSMGAIVGGLYSSGMSPAELERWFREADWHYLLSDTLPRESESLRNKERAYEINQGIAFQISRSNGLKLPAAFVSGRNVMASLRKLTVPVRHVDDFDRLPIPFRAMATDIETGDLVVLKEGDLVEAMRASMSIPALFMPVKMGDHLLADGGMTNNLPISQVQKMGADTVIAVNVSEELHKGDELDTAPAMALQMITILLQRQMKEEIARLSPSDVQIRVKIDDMTSTDFAKAVQGIEVGYAETMRMKESLARYALTPEEYRRHLEAHRLPRGGPVLVEFLKIRTPRGDFEHPVAHPFDFLTNDHEATVRLQSRLGDLGELQGYEVGDYEVLNENGRYGLLVEGRERKNGHHELSFGFEFGYSSTDESDFGLLVTHRMTHLNSLGAEWSNHLRAGNSSSILSEWYQPVDAGRRFFVVLHGLASTDFVDGRSADGDPLRFRQDDYLIGADVGMRLWQAGELRLGYNWGETEINRRLDVPEDVPHRSDRGWMHADLVIDTLDAPNFATHGVYGQVSAQASRHELGASDDYTRINGQVYKPISLGKNTLVPRVSGSFKVDGDEVPLYDQMPLGGFLNLSGLPRGNLFGENFALAELVYYRKIAELNPSTGKAIYGGFSAEYGEVWGPRDFRLNDGIFAGSVFLGADTTLGGIYLGAGVDEDGDYAVYLRLGSLFGQGRPLR